MATPLKIILFALLLFPVVGIAQKKQVSIRISQDDAFISLDKYESHIVLKRKSFKIQVMLTNIEGVYSFAGFTDSICCRLGEIDTLPHFSLLPELTMAEADYNKEKELLVGEKDCSYWYYDKNLNGHRFNKKIVMLDTNIFIGVKTVKQVYYVPEKREIKFKDLRTPLYLFFVAVDEFDESGKPKKELMRRKLKIEWSDED